MALAQVATLDFNGKTVNLWTQGQLENLNATVLRSRALDLRDMIDHNQVPRMPRHPEQVIQWIISVQNALPQLRENSQQFGQDNYAPPQADRRYDESSSVRSSPYAHLDADTASNAAPSVVGAEHSISGRQQSDVISSYSEGRSVANQARQRSRGTTGLLSWE